MILTQKQKNKMIIIKWYLEVRKQEYKDSGLLFQAAIQEIKDCLTASQKEFFYFDEVNVSKKILNKLVKDGVLYQPQNSEKYILL
ncbi:MAG TPA: hypothetical protein VKN74_06495 [Candidatus Mcinerneyibacterium sp.]|nr:hypothetical protein [Candidatus Mcinerneyibacterium sp.]